MRILLLAFPVIVLFAGCTNSTTTAPVSQKNSVVENILNRRTIRQYKTDQIKKEQLDTILNCAINAPSARNYQPWEIRVLQNPELLKKINVAFNEFAIKQDPNNEKAKDANYSIFYHAPTLIVVARDTANTYSSFDCGLLTQNILLSAKSMEIGSVCLGWLSNFLQTEDAAEIVSSLEIPTTHKITIVVGLGYPDETPQAKPRETARIKYFN